MKHDPKAQYPIEWTDPKETTSIQKLEKAGWSKLLAYVSEEKDSIYILRENDAGKPYWFVIGLR